MKVITKEDVDKITRFASWCIEKGFAITFWADGSFRVEQEGDSRTK